MASLGTLLWVIAIGALLFFMMRKGGGCCGGSHDEDQKVKRKELSHRNYGDSKEKPRGGCCG
jgi:hypothetical protein